MPHAGSPVLPRRARWTCIGFLLSIAIGLGFYAMTTLPVSVMSYIDPFIFAIYFGIGGAAIGWSLGRGSTLAPENPDAYGSP